MAHELYPKDGKSFLAPSEIVERLKKEFQVVEADAEEGRRYVRGCLRQAKKDRARGAPDMDEYIRLLELAQDDAVSVAIADSPRPGKAYQTVMVKPEAALFFAYESRQHEDAAAPLAQRVAKVLDYEIFVV